MDAAGAAQHPRIVGDRTSLRPASESDLDVLTGWFADPEVYEWWGGQPLTRNEVAADYTGRRSPDVESLIVETDGKPIGYLQYWRRTDHSGGLDMYLIPEARGRGLGPDAARATVDFLFRVRGWTEVTVDPLADNEQAIRAWARAGFAPEREGRVEESGKPCLIMAVRRSDPPDGGPTT
jgi:aminoglycoside 6'-N-acetyltransferase